ncbi:ATP-binding protein [Spirosoma gilvum]
MKNQSFIDKVLNQDVRQQVPRLVYAIYRVGIVIFITFYAFRGEENPYLLNTTFSTPKFIIINYIWLVSITYFYLETKTAQLHFTDISLGNYDDEVSVWAKRINLLISWSLLFDGSMAILLIGLSKKSTTLNPLTVSKQLVYLIHFLYWLVIFHSYYFPTYSSRLKEKIEKYKWYYFFTGGGFSSALIVTICWLYFNKEYGEEFTRLSDYNELLVFSLIVSIALATLVRITVEDRQKKKEALTKSLQIKHDELVLANTNYEQAKENLILDQQKRTALLEALKILLTRAKDSPESNGTLEKALGSELENFASLISQQIQVEYCAIGSVEGQNVKDIAIFVKGGPKDKFMAPDMSRGTLANTFVGKVLTSEEGKARGLNIPNEANHDKVSELIKAIPSKQHKSYLLVGLYERVLGNERGRPVGYIHLVNKLDPDGHIDDEGFSYDDESTIELIANQLELVATILKIRQGKYEDEKFLNTLTNEAQANLIIRKAFDYLNQEFNCNLTSLWMPIEEGFAEDKEENLHVILRTVKANESIYGGEKEANELEELLGKELAYPVQSNECFVANLLLTKFKEPIQAFQESISMNRTAMEIQIIAEKNFSTNSLNSWNAYESIICAESLLVIPFYRTRAKHNMTGNAHASTPWWEHILGIICLRVSADQFPFLLNIHLQERLKNFASHFSTLLENSIYQARYEKLSLLKNGLLNLPFEEIDESAFYKVLVSTIKDAMECEACTLFLKNSTKNFMVIKASTAEYYYSNKFKTKPLPTASIINKDLYPLSAEKSITTEVLKKGKTFMTNNAENNKNASFRFVEHIDNQEKYDHKAFIATPIGKRSEVIGVVRCVYKKNEGFVKTFNRFDEEFLSLIVGIITRFIDYLSHTKERFRFIGTFSHEFSGPLQEIMGYNELGALRMQRFRTLSENEEKRQPQLLNLSRQLQEYFSIQTDEIEQLSLVLQDFQVNLGSESGSNLDLRPQPVLSAIDNVWALLRRKAEVEKGINIKRGISNLKPQDSAEIELNVDILRFKQVFYNLFKNAVRYSYTKDEAISKGLQGGHIGVYYNTMYEKVKQYPNTTNWHTFEIENWGIGIPQEDVKKLFEWGYRSDNAKEYVPSGSGIGLYVVHQIMVQHGGFVKVVNNINPTMFRVYFPKNT